MFHSSCASENRNRIRKPRPRASVRLRLRRSRSSTSSWNSASNSVAPNCLVSGAASVCMARMPGAVRIFNTKSSSRSGDTGGTNGTVRVSPSGELTTIARNVSPLPSMSTSKLS
jgi:hypothetical protein